MKYDIATQAFIILLKATPAILGIAASYHIGKYQQAMQDLKQRKKQRESLAGDTIKGKEACLFERFICDYFVKKEKIHE